MARRGFLKNGQEAAKAFSQDLTAWLHRYAYAATVVYTRPGLSPRAAIRLKELGVRDILTLEIDDSPIAWTRLILEILSGGVGKNFLDAFPEDLPERVREFLVASAERVADPGPASVSALCETSIYGGASTLYRALRNAGLPPAARLARWARVYRVIHFAEKGGVTLEQAALHFGYPSNRSLSNQVKRLTGQPPSSILRRGGAPLLLRILREEIAGSRARERRRKPEIVKQMPENVDGKSAGVT